MDSNAIGTETQFQEFPFDSTTQHCATHTHTQARIPR
jgi:hypothetical protein